MYQGLSVMVQAAAAALHRSSRANKETIPVEVIEQLLLSYTDCIMERLSLALRSDCSIGFQLSCMIPTETMKHRSSDELCLW